MTSAGFGQGSGARLCKFECAESRDVATSSVNQVRRGDMRGDACNEPRFTAMGPRRSRVARQGLPGAKVRGARTLLLRGMIRNACDCCQSGWSSVEDSGAHNLRPPRVSEEGVGLVSRHTDADDGSILFDTCITENMCFVASSAVGGDAGQRVGEVVVSDLWKASAPFEDVMRPVSFCLSLCPSISLCLFSLSLSLCLSLSLSVCVFCVSVCLSVRLWVRLSVPLSLRCASPISLLPHSSTHFSLQNAPAAWMTMDE